VDALLALLRLEPGLYVGLVFVLGLIVGSFLNVVIHRLPIMMQRDWRRQCAELAGSEPAPEEPAVYDLVRPRSACPHCGHRITALENVPLLSYLWLRGRCAGCRARISVRYPAVELLTGVTSAVVAWRFGVGIEALAGLVLTWSLIALAGIDLDTQYLPDSITLPLVWLGLLSSLVPPAVPYQSLFPAPAAAIVGAAAGYLSLWTVFQLFRLLTGKEGMGFGDFKLLAALGAWLGWQRLLLIIPLSACVGALVGIGLIVLRRHERAKPIPFGPFLAAGGWIAMLWGNEIVAAYLGIVLG
jgi:leader peptidase (prepilin peptidase) / N-methyltransferase